MLPESPITYDTPLNPYDLPGRVGNPRISLGQYRHFSNYTVR